MPGLLELSKPMIVTSDSIARRKLGILIRGDAVVTAGISNIEQRSGMGIPKVSESF